MQLYKYEPKKKFWDLYNPLKENLIDIDSLNSKIYEIKTVELDYSQITQILSEQTISEMNDKILESENLETIQDKLSNDVKEYLNSMTKHISFFRNSHLYQGTLLTISGITTNFEKLESSSKQLLLNLIVARDDIIISNPPLLNRPALINTCERGGIDDITIKLHFIYSTNKSIKSYMYNAVDSIQVISPELTTKFVKNNRDVKRDEVREEVQVLYVDSVDELNKEFIHNVDKYSILSRPIVILCRTQEVYEELAGEESTLNTKFLRTLLKQESYI
ncbi:MAG: hypothetical protein ACLFPL_03070 [Candidatus Nanoarchaeia archaeon]